MQRLYIFVSAAFLLSRTNSSAAISKGIVFVNNVWCDKTDAYIGQPVEKVQQKLGFLLDLWYNKAVIKMLEEKKAQNQIYLNTKRDRIHDVSGL